MKYDVVEEHISNLQEVVEMSGSTANVKEIYDRCVRDYTLNKVPNIYCLRGDEYKEAKQTMREICFHKTEGLVNVILNAQAKQQ